MYTMQPNHNFNNEQELLNTVFQFNLRALTIKSSDTTTNHGYIIADFEKNKKILNEFIEIL